MGLISPIPAAGGSTLVSVKPLGPFVAQPLAPVSEEPASPELPPVQPSPNSEAVVLERALPPPDPEQDAVAVDNIPATDDAAILTDDVDPVGMDIIRDAPKPVEYDLTVQQSLAQLVPEESEDPDDPAETRKLAEAAQLAYYTERLIARSAGAPDDRLAGLHALPLHALPAKAETPVPDQPPEEPEAIPQP